MTAAIHPIGVDHLAIATRDMKGQLAFFTDVLGCPLRALYRMHGAEGVSHAFVGVPAIGPIDHGFCQSLYFAGPEGLLLELATGAAIDPRAWIDPEVVAMNGISAEELESYCKPASFSRQEVAVPQPAYDPAKPHIPYPDDVYQQILATDDDVVWKMASQPDPPVRLD